MCLKVELQRASRFYKAQGNKIYSTVYGNRNDLHKPTLKTLTSQIIHGDLPATVASSTKAVDEVVLLMTR